MRIFVCWNDHGVWEKDNVGSCGRRETCRGIHVGYIHGIRMHTMGLGSYGYIYGDTFGIHIMGDTSDERTYRKNCRNEFVINGQIAMEGERVKAGGRFELHNMFFLHGAV